mmetsp:Transcript_33340/g.105667  ORF Transcript_33340/g.105667 Transcript_33340/m.105667 type:complete len:273 (-) Transcript_33340:147-965(-)
MQEGCEAAARRGGRLCHHLRHHSLEALRQADQLRPAEQARCNRREGLQEARPDAPRPLQLCGLALHPSPPRWMQLVCSPRKQFAVLPGRCVHAGEQAERAAGLLCVQRRGLRVTFGALEQQQHARGAQTGVRLLLISSPGAWRCSHLRDLRAWRSERLKALVHPEGTQEGHAPGRKFRNESAVEPRLRAVCGQCAAQRRRRLPWMVLCHGLLEEEQPCLLLLGQSNGVPTRRPLQHQTQFAGVGLRPPPLRAGHDFDCENLCAVQLGGQDGR